VCGTLTTLGALLSDGVRFRRIDDQNRGHHFHLTADDECYFLYEYTSSQNYTFSSTNSLISNLKKKPTLAHQQSYRYKRQGIRECSAALSQTINPKWLDGATLVPVPPSKARGHPDYDDRVTQICRGITSVPEVDVREIVVQNESLQAAHESAGARPTVEDLLRVYRIDETAAVPAPERIGIVDDVLTAGTHFRATEIILHRRFPDVKIVGFFVARRVFANPFEGIE
jgi:predicted amidophosphoribosyltransferase